MGRREKRGVFLYNSKRKVLLSLGKSHNTELTRGLQQMSTAEGLYWDCIGFQGLRGEGFLGCICIFWKLWDLFFTLKLMGFVLFTTEMIRFEQNWLYWDSINNFIVSNQKPTNYIRINIILWKSSNLYPSSGASTNGPEFIQEVNNRSRLNTEKRACGWELRLKIEPVALFRLNNGNCDRFSNCWGDALSTPSPR